MSTSINQPIVNEEMAKSVGLLPEEYQKYKTFLVEFQLLPS